MLSPRARSIFIKCSYLFFFTGKSKPRPGSSSAARWGKTLRAASGMRQAPLPGPGSVPPQRSFACRETNQTCGIGIFPASCNSCSRNNLVRKKKNQFKRTKSFLAAPEKIVYTFFLTKLCVCTPLSPARVFLCELAQKTCLASGWCRLEAFPPLLLQPSEPWGCGGVRGRRATDKLRTKRR